MAAKILIRVQPELFDAEAESAWLCGGHKNIGALVTFTGLCRDENGTLAALELEHYPGMAEAELEDLAQKALSRWTLDGLVIIHRHGMIVPPAPIVFVATASAHRRDAFEAADFVMDYLKTRAPFWKKQHFTDGSSSSWVEAKSTDAAAAIRWADDCNGDVLK